MSVVNENTVVSMPGTGVRTTGGTTSTSSTERDGRRADSISRRKGSWPPTVRNMSSASADGEITFGATPPLMSPTL